MKYRIRLTALAPVHGHVTVEAESRDEADTLVREHLGDVEWHSDGINAETVNTLVVDTQP